MPKSAVSVTLDRDNLLWLRGRVAAGAGGSLSELVDHLITVARSSGVGAEAGIRSVVGSIDIAASDPDLLEADAYIRLQVEQPLERPMLARERAPRKRSGRG